VIHPQLRTSSGMLASCIDGFDRNLTMLLE